MTFNEQIKEIETEIAMGQIEEVIEMAKDELDVVRHFIGTFYRLFECVKILRVDYFF